MICCYIDTSAHVTDHTQLHILIDHDLDCDPLLVIFCGILHIVLSIRVFDLVKVQEMILCYYVHIWIVLRINL